jgi:hypothetical protein
MTNMRKFGTHGFIKLDRVRGKPIRGKIVEVTESQFSRPILRFEDGSQFSLNGTNTDTMLDVYGEDDRNWIGQVVELYEGMLRVAGGEQEGVRLRPISLPEHYGDGGNGAKAPATATKKATAAEPAKKTKLGEEMDDTIPF